MISKRTITGLIIFIGIIFSLLMLSPKAFALLNTLIILWASWEWSTLMGVKRLLYRLMYVAGVFFLLIVSQQFYIFNIIVASLIWWVIALLLVIFYPRFSHVWGKSVFFRALMGVATLIPWVLVINFIRNIPNNGIFVLMYLIILIAAADAAAYFSGRLFGKIPLAPKASPGKTLEGLVGALIVTSVITLVALYWAEVSYKISFFVCIIAMITVLFSVLGDLFESILKRNVGLKDSGWLLPGQGGILDRIDSLTAAAPAFLFGIYMLKKITPYDVSRFF